MKKFALLVAVLAIVVASVSADRILPEAKSEGLSLTINTQDVFELDPRWYNIVHLNVMIGNQGSEAATQLEMDCKFDSEYAYFETVNDWNNSFKFNNFLNDNGLGAQRLLLQSNSLDTGKVLNRGQFDTFQFIVRVAEDAPAGTEIDVTCTMRQRIEGGNLPVVGQDSMTIVVRNW